jgi:hypothetical protein
MPHENRKGRPDRIGRILDALAVNLAATNDEFDRMREEHDRGHIIRSRPNPPSAAY